MEVPRSVAIEAGGRRWPFPLYSARPGDCSEPEAVVDGVAMCRRSANNVLFVAPPADLPDRIMGWRRVGAKPRWNAFIEGDQASWQPNQLSLQRRGQHRFWGMRDHVRLWIAPDGSHAIGQAHREDWQRWPRRHRVLELDAARDALESALPECEMTHHRVASDGRGWDGRVLVATWRGSDTG